MTWASELAQTLKEPTEMTMKWKAILSFVYILILQFLEGPKNQAKRQEQASSVSSINGSVSNTAVPAWGLVYMWESGVGVTSHKDVAAPVLTFLPFQNPKSYCCCCCSWMLLMGMSQEPQGMTPRDLADCRQDSEVVRWGATAPSPPPPGQVDSHSTTTSSRYVTARTEMRQISSSCGYFS